MVDEPEYDQRIEISRSIFEQLGEEGTLMVQDTENDKRVLMEIKE